MFTSHRIVLQFFEWHTLFILVLAGQGALHPENASIPFSSLNGTQLTVLHPDYIRTKRATKTNDRSAWSKTDQSRYPIKDSTSLRGRLVMADIPQLRWLQGWVQPWLWPLVTVARLHQLLSVHLRPTSIAPEILCTRKKPAVCHAQSKSKTSVFFAEKQPHIKRQHDGCMQSCSGIPNVWVGVVSSMVLIALMVDSPKAQANVFQLKLSVDWNSFWFAPEVN